MRTGRVGQTITVVVVVLPARALAPESPFMTRGLSLGRLGIGDRDLGFVFSVRLEDPIANRVLRRHVDDRPE